MKVIKIGGGSLKGSANIDAILNLMAERGLGHIFVVSALGGITDRLLSGADEALADEAAIPGLIEGLRADHETVARGVIKDKAARAGFLGEMDELLGRLERYYYGLAFTREVTPRLRDTIAVFGERLSARLLSWALQGMGVDGFCLEPQDIGLVTDGRFGDATANLRKTRNNLRRNLEDRPGPKSIMVVPGFYGMSESGDITTFGRGGSDYAAAVIASALPAEVLEVWKDVEGFMSADPKFAPEARLIPVLSYEEAAELCYFGAKILHPRTVEPIRKVGLEIAVKNTMHPDAQGSIITKKSSIPPHVIKSVAHDTDVGVIKVHGSGVGARPGILAHITGHLSDCGINIRSVVTSQTCISLLLARHDLEDGYQALKSISPQPFRHLEPLSDLALIGLVGDGLLRRKGIAARCFTAVADRNINVEMISSGPSKVAMYFLVKEKDLNAAMTAIHRSFFSGDE